MCNLLIYKTTNFYNLAISEDIDLAGIILLSPIQGFIWIESKVTEIQGVTDGRATPKRYSLALGGRKKD